MIKKYFQTVNQDTVLKLHALKCPFLPLGVDLDVAGELIGRVSLTEFGQIIKFRYTYTRLNIRVVLIFTDHSANIVTIFGTSQRYNNNSETEII